MFALALDAWASWGGPWDEFVRVRPAAFVIVGELEEAEAGEKATPAAALMPDGRAVVLPGLGHVAAFVRSDLVAPLAIRVPRHGRTALMRPWTGAPSSFLRCCR
jgi:hypothetical protein